MTYFGDLPGDLQESILHRAFINNITLARCQCVCKDWLNICLKLTTIFGWIRSKQHFGSAGSKYSEDSESEDSDEAYCTGSRVGVQHYHRIFRLFANLFLVVRTGGRRHRRILLEVPRRSGSSQCSMNQWHKSSPDRWLPAGVVAQQSFYPSCRSRLSIQARGIEVLFQTDGRMHQGEVKMVVGDSELDRDLCALCTTHYCRIISGKT